MPGGRSSSCARRRAQGQIHSGGFFDTPIQAVTKFQRSGRCDGRRPHDASSEAFSLVEVLVASAVMGILMMILLGTMGATLSLWRTGERKISADREGRALQLMLMQDLRNVVMPRSPALWPRVVSNGANIHLQFLALLPTDYQTNPSDAGDICFIDYALVPGERRLMRSFKGSAETLAVLQAGSFPAPSTNSAQLVASALLPENRQAVRRMALGQYVTNSNFVILDTNLHPISCAYSAGNCPAMIEFNFAAVDSQTATNAALLENTNALLPGAALFSFRVDLPDPQP
ncbi:MAG: prepilin-type N-terminal cleavage/methylation domain-containing protein [Chthoniobacterales bacterium]|nr:prepilin-type N-terminal cleavage/methylation domain-containing protein [Chthoniobacterales bacterium]